MMRDKNFYEQLATALDAWRRCQQTGNTEWETKWDQTIKDLTDKLPSGSGFDAGTEFDRIRSSTGHELVFHTRFHHMNEGGFYTEWTEHMVRVRPSFILGLDITVCGRNVDDIKNYIAEAFHSLVEV